MFELVLSAVVFVATVAASGHAVIYKREPRAAALWIIVIWLVPAAGPISYPSVRCQSRSAAGCRDARRHGPTSHDPACDIC